MTRKEIRDRLRAEVRDTAMVEFPTDVELDDLINTAYFLVQKEIRKQAPLAHLFWDYINLQKDVNWYPFPQTFSIIQIGTKALSTDTSYTKREPHDYNDINTYTGTQPVYARRGQWFGIFPAPTADVANGIEVVHVPIMSMSADTDIARIKVPLHIAIVWWAKLLALGETDEDVDKTRTRLNEILGDLDTWYDQDLDSPDKFQIVA